MMIGMTQEINAKFEGDKAHVSCYTCHRGETEPKVNCSRSRCAAGSRCASRSCARRRLQRLHPNQDLVFNSSGKWSFSFFSFGREFTTT